MFLLIFYDAIVEQFGMIGKNSSRHRRLAKSVLLLKQQASNKQQQKHQDVVKEI